jgi:ribose-phosphate pyrophosphokinase
MAIPHLVSDCQDGVIILTSKNISGVAEEIARTLQHQGVPIEYTQECVVDVKIFSDGELCPDIQPNVRDKVVFLFWDFTPTDFVGHINIRKEELLLTLDALKRAKVRSVNLIAPYLPYSRQDRRMRRQPLSAKMLAEGLEARGCVDQLVTFDLHAPQITGFYDTIHVENIPAHVIFSRYVRERFAEEIKGDKLRIMSTDVGGSKRARDFAECIDPGMDISIVDKRRDDLGSKAMKLVGDVSDVMIAYDDIGGTMGSMLDACKIALGAGAHYIYGAITHNVCSPKNGVSAEAKIAEAGIEIFTLDTLPRGKEYYRKNPLITRVPYTDFMAEVITQMISVDGSISRIVKTWAAK